MVGKSLQMKGVQNRSISVCWNQYTTISGEPLLVIATVANNLLMNVSAKFDPYCYKKQASLAW
jgi:hypothetical protein